MTDDRPGEPDQRLDPAVDESLIPRLDAAKQLGLPPEALDRAAKRGDITALRDADTRRVYFRREELTNYERRVEDGSVSVFRARGAYTPTSDGRPKAFKPIPERERRTTPGVPGKPTGRWIGRYRDVDGKVRQVGIRRSKDQAAKETARRIAKVTGARLHSADEHFTIGYLANHWPYAARLDPRTVSTNRERLERYFIPYLKHKGATPLREITNARVLCVQDRLLERGLAKTTIDGAIAAMRALWKDASQLGIVAREPNPAARVTVDVKDHRLNPKPRRKHRAIRLDELRAFAIELPAPWVARALIPRFTGVRPGEFPVINLRRLDRNAQMLHIGETLSAGAPPAPRKGTKTHRVTPENANPGRWVPFPSALTDWLLELQPEPIDGYVIRAPRGGHYPLRNLYRKIWTPAMNKAVHNAGIERFDLGDLRHTYTSYLHAAGVPDADIMKWMGHSDPRSAAQWRSGAADRELPDISTNAYVYRHGTNDALKFALSVLTETIDAIRDATGRQLRLLSDDLEPEPRTRPGERARRYAHDPATGVRAILNATFPVEVHERVPITAEIASRLTPETWQQVIDAYSPPSELRRQLRSVAPTTRGEKRTALLRAAADYRDRHGHLRVPRRHVTPDGLALGKFMQNQRDAYRGTTNRRLTEQQADELDRIDTSWRDGVVPSSRDSRSSAAGSFRDQGAHLVARPPKASD
jgi:hypothetical protein